MLFYNFKNNNDNDNDKDNYKVKHPELRILPTLVGIVTPLSLILTIPPLEGNWISLESLSEEQYQIYNANIACLSLAIIFQIIGTITLLFRFWERKIRSNTLLTVVFLSLHVICIIISIIIYYERWQKHYYNLVLNLVGILVSATSILFLMIDYFKNNHLINKNSGIVNKQRMFIIYLILNTVWGKIGTIIFCILEDWGFVDGLYFILVTNTTIGFGDVFPNNQSSQIFLFFYALIGIVFMGLFINAIRIALLEKIETKFLLKLKEIEDNRKKNKIKDIKERDNNESENINDSDQINNVKYNSNQCQIITLLNSKLDYKNASFIRRKKRKLVNKEKLIIIKRQFIFAIIYLLLFWFLGGVIFMYSENWTYFESFNFCFVSFTTIGYGNITPKTLHGKVVFIVYALLGLVAATYLISIGTELGSFVLYKRIENLHANYKIKLQQNKFSQTREQLVKDFESEIIKNNHSILNDNNKDELICNLVAMSKIYQKLIANLIADQDNVLTREILEKKEFIYLEEYHYLYCHLLNQMSKNMEVSEQKELKNNEKKMISKLNFDFMDDVMLNYDIKSKSFNTVKSNYFQQEANDNLIP
ncbi:voltage-gated potassium channel [Neoconidiobolus thromboides FSU 785]|nr:voltage-gated potassium channel [Neoconidiobolus thromboides FSU 785]